jgi:predicted amidohydrolase
MGATELKGMPGIKWAATTQIEAFWARSEGEFSERLRPVVEHAAHQGAELVALPRYVGMCLLGLLDPSDERPDAREALEPEDRQRLVARYRVGGDPLLEAYERTGSQLARESRLYLVFGSALSVGDDGRLSEVAYLFRPDGSRLGVQRRTHLECLERQDEWHTADELLVFETPVGRLGVIIGEDVLHPEVSRILCLQGANVLVHLCLGRSLRQAEWMRHLWREVQANQVFGLESCLIGDRYPGLARVHGPLEMAADGSGVLACSERADCSVAVVAWLDFDELQHVVDAYPIYGMLNHEMYRKYFPDVYAGGR